MKITRLLATAALVAFVCTASYAQDTVASDPAVVPEVPVFQGGKVMAEINLTNRDILPMIKDSIKVLGFKTGGPLPPPLAMLEAMNTDDLHAALADLAAIRGVVYLIPTLEKPETVVEFYRQQVKGPEWSRVLLLHPNDSVSVNVYARGTQGMYGFVVKKEAKGATVVAVGTRGMVNLPKLIEWGKSAASAFVLVKEEGHQPPPQVEAE
jgi:hypothetical protein